MVLSSLMNIKQYYLVNEEGKDILVDLVIITSIQFNSDSIQFREVVCSLNLSYVFNNLVVKNEVNLDHL